MKALAAANIRQFERAAEAVAMYNRTVDWGLRNVLQDQNHSPEEQKTRRSGSTGAIIFGSDQGMCGQFNENIVTYAMKNIDEHSGTDGVYSDSMVIGLRAASQLSESGQSFEKLFPIPSSVDGINPAVQSLLLTINTWREEKNIDKVILYYNRPISGASYEPARVQLFPIDMSLFQGPVQKLCASRSLPTYTMEPSRLLPLLLRQYLFAQLYRAYADSLTSENTSRLLTMQAAEKNIEERLAELRVTYHGQRQGAITSELLDIVSGFEILSG
jgi:F-type H+-transporting ATPase subunit gamma